MNKSNIIKENLNLNTVKFAKFRTSYVYEPIMEKKYIKVTTKTWYITSKCGWDVLQTRRITYCGHISSQPATSKL